MCKTHYYFNTFTGGSNLQLGLRTTQVSNSKGLYAWCKSAFKGYGDGSVTQCLPWYRGWINHIKPGDVGMFLDSQCWGDANRRIPGACWSSRRAKFISFGLRDLVSKNKMGWKRGRHQVSLLGFTHTHTHTHTQYPDTQYRANHDANIQPSVVAFPSLIIILLPSSLHPFWRLCLSASSGNILSFQLSYLHSCSSACPPQFSIWPEITFSLQVSLFIQGTSF